MTKQRALEIWNTKGPFGQFTVTDQEDKEIKEVWNKMNHSSSWVSALLEIANGRKEHYENLL